MVLAKAGNLSLSSNDISSCLGVTEELTIVLDESLGLLPILVGVQLIWVWSDSGTFIFSVSLPVEDCSYSRSFRETLFLSCVELSCSLELLGLNIYNNKKVVINQNLLYCQNPKLFGIYLYVKTVRKMFKKTVIPPHRTFLQILKGKNYKCKNLTFKSTFKVVPEPVTNCSNIACFLFNPSTQEQLPGYNLAPPSLNQTFLLI